MKRNIPKVPKTTDVTVLPIIQSCIAASIIRVPPKEKYAPLENRLATVDRCAAKLLRRCIDLRRSSSISSRSPGGTPSHQINSHWSIAHQEPCESPRRVKLVELSSIQESMSYRAAGFPNLCLVLLGSTGFKSACWLGSTLSTKVAEP